MLSLMAAPNVGDGIFFGQLGDNTTTARFVPTNVVGLSSGVTTINAAGNHSCAIVNGSVKCWGSNGNGQLGNNSLSDSLIPVNVIGLNSGVIYFGEGYAHSHNCVVHNGGAKCWGSGKMDGELGINSFSDRWVPDDVYGLTTGVANISMGVSHSCATLDDGTAKCWGNNVAGQLGNNTTVRSLIPVDVLVP